MLKKNIGILLVLLVTLLVYFPSLFYHFVGDDYVALARLVTRPSLKQAYDFRWPPIPTGPYFRPLVFINFLLGYALSGLPMPPDPRWQSNSFLFSYHFLNVFFHLLNVLFVYLIASFILKSRIYSIFAAFIFAVHPVNSEVVCWVSAIGDIGCVLFLLLSIILFVKFCQTKGRTTSFLYYSGSLISFIFALLYKEAALYLPPLIILISYLLKNLDILSLGRKVRISWSGYFLVLFFYLVIRKLLLPLGGLKLQGFFNNIPGNIFKIAYLLRDLILPFDLYTLKLLLYRYSLLSIFGSVAIFLSGLFLFIFILKRKKFPVLAFFLSFIAITLILPVLGGFAPGKRHLYLPLAGYSILFTYSISLLKRRYIGIYLLILFISCQLWTSLKRNYLFQIGGGVVQKGLFELKEQLPEVESDSVICLVGIPGTIKNTPAFWASPEAKINFLYRDAELDVLCLSVVAFTEKSMQDTHIIFLVDFTLMQSMQNKPEEFIRISTEGPKEKGSDWRMGFQGKFQFNILERDEFGKPKKVMFRLNPEFLKGRKIYFLGLKDGKIQILKFFQRN